MRWAETSAVFTCCCIAPAEQNLPGLKSLNPALRAMRSCCAPPRAPPLLRNPPLRRVAYRSAWPYDAVRGARSTAVNPCPAPGDDRSGGPPGVPSQQY